MEEEWLKIKIESCTAPPEHDHGLAFARALPEFRHRWVDLQLTCGDGAGSVTILDVMHANTCARSSAQAARTHCDAICGWWQWSSAIDLWWQP